MPDLWDETNEEFILGDEHVLVLEHSLISISKWECKWHKPFINGKKTSSHTGEELIDYIKCMTLNKVSNPAVYEALSEESIKEIADYIDDPMTATKFTDKKEGKGRGPVRSITNEEIYYQMIANGIPFECEKWHLNRLITLIRVCQIRNNGSEKMSKGEIMRSNKALNEARRAAHHTKG